ANDATYPGISRLLNLFEHQGNVFKRAGVNNTTHLDVVTALKRFVDYFDYVHAKYEHVILVGDFIEYDYGILNAYVGQYLQRPLLNYYSSRVRYPIRAHSTSTFYQTVCSISEICATPIPEQVVATSDDTPPGQKKALEILGVRVPESLRHDHNPEN